MDKYSPLVSMHSTMRHAGFETGAGTMQAEFSFPDVAFEVLDRALVTTRRGGLDPMRDTVGYLTLCKLPNGLRFAVREDICAGFDMSSNERWGMRGGNINRQREFLAVLVSTGVDFESVAQLVEAADDLNRPSRPAAFKWSYVLACLDPSNDRIRRGHK